MTDHPMLFSAPMILALLREAKEPGTGKTQTRRILRPQPEFTRHHEPVRPEHRGGRKWVFMCRTDAPSYSWATADFMTKAAPGDRVWCREKLECANGEAVGYPSDRTWLPNTDWRWKRRTLPSIHMPRGLSRLTLYVSEVRVQRLQDICEADARAEGAYVGKASGRVADNYATMAVAGHWFASARGWYADLWERLNGPGSWEANPWVACYSFKPVLANIDTLPANMMEDA